jgi:hypothetical protein
MKYRSLGVGVFFTDGYSAAHRALPSIHEKLKSCENSHRRPGRVRKPQPRSFYRHGRLERSRNSDLTGCQKGNGVAADRQKCGLPTTLLLILIVKIRTNFKFGYIIIIGHQADHPNHRRPSSLSQVRPTVLSTLILRVSGSKT